MFALFYCHGVLSRYLTCLGNGDFVPSTALAETTLIRRRVFLITIEDRYSTYHIFSGDYLVTQYHTVRILYPALWQPLIRAICSRVNSRPGMEASWPIATMSSPVSCHRFQQATPAHHEDHFVHTLHHPIQPPISRNHL